MFHIYLARCSDDSLYAGYCRDIAEREKTHNDGTGAKYTRSRRPVQIVYSEEYATRSEAMKREAEIKGMSRGEKEDLISQKNSIASSNTIEKSYLD